VALGPRTVVVFRWRERDPKRRGDWQNVQWPMSDEEAAAYARRHGVELQKIDGTREERHEY
jgi:hypothetical protein